MSEVEAGSMPVHRRRFVTSIALPAALIVIATAPGGLESDDANVRYETAISWVDGQGGALRQDSDRGVAGKDGRKYSYYNLTQSLVLAATLNVMRAVHAPRPEQTAVFVYSLLFLSLLFAALALLLDGVARALGVSGRAGLVVLLVGTPLLHYARIGQEENILATCCAGILLGSAWVLLRRPEGWALVGAFSGLAILTRVGAVPIVMVTYAVLARAWLTDARNPARRGWAFAGLLPLGIGAGATAVWNWYRFGNPFESGYRYAMDRLGEPFFELSKAPERSLALLVSPARGIILYAPVLLGLPLALSAARSLPEPGRRLVRFGLIAFVTNLLFFSIFSIGEAGQGWGSRYLAASLVFLAPLFLLASWRSPAAVLLVVVSIVIQLESLVVPTNTEDHVGMIRRAAGTPCTPWALDCSGIVLRPGFAERALVNAATNRPLPTIEQGAFGSAQIALQSSDYAAPSWWLVRIAYRMGKGTPRLALGISLALLALGLVLLWRAVRAEPTARPELATGR